MEATPSIISFRHGTKRYPGVVALDAVSVEEIEALFERGSDVRLKSQSVPPVEDGRATVDVVIEITHEAGVETVDRSWELERGADGVWRFAELPDCF